MKVLTLHQPWATLTALGIRTIETRSWSTKYRGPLAIHASRRPPCSYLTETWVGNWKAHRRCGDGGYDLSLYQATEPELSPEPWRGVLNMIELPLGAIIGTCTLVDVLPIVGLGEETAVRRVEVGTMGGAPNLMLCAPDPAVTEYSPDVGFQFNDDFDASDYYERDVTDQLPYGDFRTPPEVKQRYAWLLDDIMPVDPPQPFKGGQGLTKTWGAEEAVELGRTQ